MSEPVKIDIWSDVACPWCYIGKRHLEQGLASLGDDAPDVVVEYHSFELAPDVPVDFEGSTADFLAERKGMPRPQVDQMMSHVAGIAARAGLDYHFDDVKQTKTLKAHELLHYAKEHGLQGDVKERLLSAYFVGGRHVGRVDDLVEIAAEAGLDATSAREALESGRYAEGSLPTSRRRMPTGFRACRSSSSTAVTASPGPSPPTCSPERSRRLPVSVRRSARDRAVRNARQRRCRRVRG